MGEEGRGQVRCHIAESFPVPFREGFRLLDDGYEVAGEDGPDPGRRRQRVGDQPVRLRLGQQEIDAWQVQDDGAGRTGVTVRGAPAGVGAGRGPEVEVACGESGVLAAL